MFSTPTVGCKITLNDLFVKTDSLFIVQFMDANLRIMTEQAESESEKYVLENYIHC